jgi:hypothetical protein
MEASIGSAAAISLAVAVNLLVFAIGGVVAGVIARWRALLVAFYLIICAFVSVIALWLADFSSAHVTVGPLLVALVIYAAPFLAVWQVASKRAAQTQPPAR